MSMSDISENLMRSSNEPHCHIRSGLYSRSSIAITLRASSHACSKRRSRAKERACAFCSKKRRASSGSTEKAISAGTTVLLNHRRHLEPAGNSCIKIIAPFTHGVKIEPCPCSKFPAIFDPRGRRTFPADAKQQRLRIDERFPERRNRVISRSKAPCPPYPGFCLSSSAP